jgi:hypothetical protein
MRLPLSTNGKTGLLTPCMPGAIFRAMLDE